MSRFLQCLVFVVYVTQVMSHWWRRYLNAFDYSLYLVSSCFLGRIVTYDTFRLLRSWLLHPFSGPEDLEPTAIFAR